MKKHFIKNIDIETFKCFSNFSASGFCHVNLIGGKNNIGKTALLEALLLGIYSSSVTSLTNALCTISARRQYPNHKKENILKYLEDYTNIKVEIEASSLESIYFENIKKELGSEFFFKTNHWKSGIRKYDFYKNMLFENQFDKGAIITPVRVGSSKDLNYFYQKIQEEDREAEVNQYIKEFDSSLDGFKFINQVAKVKKNKKYHNLSNFGDGLKSYISIILAIYSCKNGVLLIDEVENGIHYTQLNRLWEIILTTSKNSNCQIFATTHSKECIEAFNQVQLESGSFSSTYFELYKNIKTNKITAAKRTAEQLEYALTHQGKIPIILKSS
jgi:AAA15 family ATPase/GTPase